jgi:predicted DNA-binding transcriptional regulator AlpA
VACSTLTCTDAGDLVGVTAPCHTGSATARGNEMVGEMTSPGVQLVEIAEVLGVSKQRAHQIAEEMSFPAPVGEDASGRVWSRFEVQAWAKRWRTREAVAVAVSWCRRPG